MNLTERIDWALQLGDYMQSTDPAWQEAIRQASTANPWFTPENIQFSIDRIALSFLAPAPLTEWAKAELPPQQESPMTIGLVMASNLPLVGFHDWLCTFIAGHHARIKLSAQDSILFEHLRTRLLEWEPRLSPYIQVCERLNGADAYIATGSDNTSRYFEYYFGQYPHIIRKNRTSVARLTGDESADELKSLSKDMYLYFGRGCRNVTHLFVPRGYDFQPLLESGGAFQHVAEHHKFKNNYDYQLAICILNKEYYMTNGIALFVERPSLYAPIGMIYYTQYDRWEETDARLAEQKEKIQCLVGAGGVPFGTTQYPNLSDYADGVNTLDFLRTLQPRR
ncbi:MAG: hypothetical protein RL750_873 [Bacteroidota bacterium]